jgi:hypothetical protein
MVKKPVAKGAEKAKKVGRASAAAASTITVLEGEKTPKEELMKLPKAQIVRSMAIPKNRARFVVDVDNRTKQGKSIIALMGSLRSRNAAMTKAVTDILGALGNMVGKKPTSKK